MKQLTKSTPCPFVAFLKKDKCIGDACPWFIGDQCLVLNMVIVLDTINQEHARLMKDFAKSSKNIDSALAELKEIKEAAKAELLSGAKP